MGDNRQGIKDQIVHLLKMQGAQTATALAKQLQVSPMAIRQHLQTLKAAQWVTYQEERRPLGRPVKLWQLTTQSAHSTQHFPDGHPELMVDLLRSIKTVFGSEGLDRLMDDRYHRQIQTYRSRLAQLSHNPNQIPNWQQQVKAIAHLRTQEGYMAEVINLDQEQAENTLLLVENHCPICIAAQTCQKLCSTELAIFRTVLGTSVTVERVEHILQGDRRCAYRVKRREEG
jgi:predicted ArsR family transcriptional regulator